MKQQRGLRWMILKWRVIKLWARVPHMFGRHYPIIVQACMPYPECWICGEVL